MEQDRTIIIPSAKSVPEELQKFGKMPGIIYPVNQKMVFDYLYEQYRKFSAINILCYENAEEVRECLKNYLSDRVKITVLSEMRDLGYTIYCGLEHIEGSIVINFSDTIVMDDITETTGDVFFCKEDYISEDWTYFDEKAGIIEDIFDKIPDDTDIRKKLFVGVFQLTDAVYFRNCLQYALTAQNLKMSTFYYALQLYSRKYPLCPIETENWFDIGHADKYYNTELEVKAREFNHITIDRERGILRKRSDNTSKFIGEIKWYLKLPMDIEYVRPRIFDYSTDYTDPYVLMEYYSYHTIHEYFLYGDLNMSQWRKIFSRIQFVFDDFKRYTVKSGDIVHALEDMYLTKTVKRLEDTRNDCRFTNFFTNEISVNGVKYRSLDEIVEIIKKIVPSMLYDVEEFSIIHGDMCFSNIMIDENFSFIKLIDPRGKFGKFDIYGDSRYELAKLFHSIDGKYDYIIKNLFDIEYDLEKASIVYEVQERKRGSSELYRVFMDVFRNDIDDDIQKIELIEALLFLSMVPLHSESLEHQMAMLGTGLDILDRVVNIKK